MSQQFGAAWSARHGGLFGLRTLRGVDSLTSAPSCSVVTIGNFDGVHRGHRAMLARAGRIARESGCALAAVTFEPHPLTVVAPHRAPERLTPLDEKLRLLEGCGVDAAVVLESKRELLSLTAEQFIGELLVPRLRPRYFVEGPEFGFGRGRGGDVHTLAELGRRFDFQVEVVEPVRVTLTAGRDERVSSSLVRELLAAGHVADAARCLGRRYALFGTVESGRGRGKGLGFPTANLRIENQVIPGEGVYAGCAWLADTAAAPTGNGLIAAVSIGRNPTFDGQVLTVEAFLLDYGNEGELRGHKMRLELAEWVREQRRFETPAALVEQIGRDVELIRAAISVVDRRPAAAVGD